MDVVNFSEGILGIDKITSPIVAQCLRQQAGNEPTWISSKMIIVANKLDFGDRVDIESIRNIGERPLADTQKLFLSL